MSKSKKADRCPTCNAIKHNPDDPLDNCEEEKAFQEARPGPAALSMMRERGGTWAAYQNLTLDSTGLGHMQFLRFGPGCTYKHPPVCYPKDTQYGMGWKYRVVGLVNTETGAVDVFDKPMLPDKEFS